MFRRNATLNNFFFCFEVTVMICCDTEAIAAFKSPVLASEWASLRKGSRRRKAVRGRVNKFLVFLQMFYWKGGSLNYVALLKKRLIDVLILIHVGLKRIITSLSKRALFHWWLYHSHTRLRHP